MTRRHRTAARARLQRQALGAFALLAIATGVLAAATRWDPFASNAEVKALFVDAIGTTSAGTPTEVRMDGVEVGTVTSVTRVGDHALFTMNIDPAAARTLRANASAELRPRTPFEGTAFVDLAPGSAAAPLRTTIPLSRTKNYVSLYSALSFANGPTRSAIQRDVHELAATLSPPAQIGLRAALKTLPPLVKDLGPAASALAGPHDTELLGTVRGVAATFAAVAQSENNLARFVQSSSSSFAALNVDSDRPLDATIAALPDTLADLHVGQRALTSILDAADPLAQELRPGLKQLPAALRDADPLLVAGQPALSEAVPLIRELRAALSSAVQATPPARTLLAAIHPSLDVLNNSLLNALTRNTRVGLPAYLALINALQGGDGAFENFQTPAQGHQPGAIGAGHFVNFQGRFYTGYPTPTLPSCSLFSALPASIGAALQSYGLCTP